MHVTVYRHQEYNKFFVQVEKGFSVTSYVFYDISVSELAQILRELAREDPE